MKVLEKRIEKDFEQFVRGLPKLQPAEICGLCKILSVKMFDDNAEKIKVMVKEEEKECFPPRSMEDILNDLMDKFLALPKRRRREILEIFKDIKKGI